MSRSIFALKFKETVGETPMEYLTRWLQGLQWKGFRRAMAHFAPAPACSIPATFDCALRLAGVTAWV